MTLKRDGGYSSRATGKATTGNQVSPDRTGNAHGNRLLERVSRNVDKANGGTSDMKCTIFGLVIGIVLGSCPLTRAATVSDDPKATSVALNLRPAPESANPNESLSQPGGGGVSVADAQGMQEAIDKFRLLFEGGDADRLKTDIWPSMSPKQYRAVKNAFKFVSQVTLQEICPGSPAIASNSAEWTCNETVAYSVTGKPRPAQTHPVQFRFKKLDGKWYVDGRSGKVKGP